MSLTSVTLQDTAQLGSYMTLQHDSAKYPWISSLKSVSSSAQQGLLVDTGRGGNLSIIGQFGIHSKACLNSNSNHNLESTTA